MPLPPLPIPSDASSPPLAAEDAASASTPVRKARRTGLTDRKLDGWAIQRLKKPVDLSDTTVRGLVARVHPSGSRSFFLRWRSGGEFKRVRLDAATVEEARQKAVTAKAAIAIGRDPRVAA